MLQQAYAEAAHLINKFSKAIKALKETENNKSELLHGKPQKAKRYRKRDPKAFQNRVKARRRKKKK